MNLRTGMILFFACLLTGAVLQAAHAVDSGATDGAADGTGGREPKWDSDAEAGIVNTSGNAETRSINTRFRLLNEREHWRHLLHGEYLKVSDRDQTTAERAQVSFKSDYKLSEREYLFVSLRYDSDLFSGYNSRIVETTGYGRRFAFSRASRLEAEVGAGMRHTRLVGGLRDRDGIVRLAAKYTQLVGEASEFREELLSEMAGENVRTESVTSLKSRINGKLSMKLGFTSIHNSRVQPGIRKTDTITSVTLVYDFL